MKIDFLFNGILVYLSVDNKFFIADRIESIKTFSIQTFFWIPEKEFFAAFHWTLISIEFKDRNAIRIIGTLVMQSQQPMRTLSIQAF